eukprot:CAMPEP_0173181810 /NCGR_PEP_ID=MMETSP1141-20130122/7488_1 /TAXON_ID=483371 /ORGANISM="non described non described, Strain CCMP2298" /LENGTH=43 /DNA_ID= /DNA_START= /DNA_END= /DNA_ORIENTATION=
MKAESRMSTCPMNISLLNLSASKTSTHKVPRDHQASRERRTAS